MSSGFGVEHGHTGVEAGDLQQVRQEGLEPLHLVVQQLSRPLVDGVEIVAGVVQHFRGHPDGGQRSPQFMGDVRDEALLHLGQGGQLGDLLLEAGRHVVEGGAEAGHLVLAPDHHPLLQLAGREFFGDHRRHG